jgi:sigma-B regulation protein RsbU (phosphoserine phosphatase)
MMSSPEDEQPLVACYRYASVAPRIETRETFSPPRDTILLVGSDVAARETRREVLESAGCRVLVAGDARAALEHALGEVPNLVLIDFTLPDDGGRSLLRALRARPEMRALPAVFVSPEVCAGQIDAAFDAGGDDFIREPVDPRVLVACVRRTIESRRERKLRERALIVARELHGLARELEEGSQVQRAQLPQAPVDSGRWTVAGAVVPSGKVGGDVFDVVTDSEGGMTAFVIDVSGHGRAAALVAASARSALRLLLREHDTARAITILNDHLCAMGGHHYACVAAVRLTPSTVTIVNAGLPPVCVLEAGEIVARVAGAGTPPGLIENATYRSVTYTVTPFTRVVIMSDGLTEPFGSIDDVEGSLARLELDHRQPIGLDLSARIVHALGGRRASIDDATLVILDAHRAVRARESFLAQVACIDLVVAWAERVAPPWVERDRLRVGMLEAVTNAVVHGSLAVSSALRDGDGSLDAYLDAIDERSHEAAAATDRLHVAFEATADGCCFSLRWPGQACPLAVRTAPPPGLDTLAASGLGLGLICDAFDRAVWSEDGRSLTLSLIER